MRWRDPRLAKRYRYSDLAPEIAARIPINRIRFAAERAVEQIDRSIERMTELDERLAQVESRRRRR